MGPVKAKNALPNANNNEPTVELRQEDDGSVYIYFGDLLLGGIVAEGEAIRLIFSDADPGALLTMQWPGGPCSIRFDLSGGIANLKWRPKK